VDDIHLCSSFEYLKSNTSPRPSLKRSWNHNLTITLVELHVSTQYCPLTIWL
jgi:hypothetical protein